MMSVPGLQLGDSLLELLCKLPAAEICKVGHEDDGASCLWSRLQCRGRKLVHVPYAQCMGTVCTENRDIHSSYGKALPQRDLMRSLPTEKRSQSRPQCWHAAQNTHPVLDKSSRLVYPRVLSDALMMMTTMQIEDFACGQVSLIGP